VLISNNCNVIRRILILTGKLETLITRFLSDNRLLLAPLQNLGPYEKSFRMFASWSQFLYDRTLLSARLLDLLWALHIRDSLSDAFRAANESSTATLFRPCAEWALRGLRLRLTII
jgi:hypothetical protein